LVAGGRETTNEGCRCAGGIAFGIARAEITEASEPMIRPERTIRRESERA
jgi:hypothetical protein